MFSWNELRTNRTYSSEPFLRYTNVSCSKRLHLFTIAGPKGEPIGNVVNLDINFVVIWDVYWA